MFHVSVAATSINMNKHVKTAFSIMRFIVPVGWSISALGYVFGYFMVAVNEDVFNFSVIANATNMNKHVKTAFSITRFILTVGGSIYALGCVFVV